MSDKDELGSYLTFPLYFSFGERAHRRINFRVGNVVCYRMQSDMVSIGGRAANCDVKAAQLAVRKLLFFLIRADNLRFFFFIYMYLRHLNALICLKFSRCHCSCVCIVRGCVLLKWRVESDKNCGNEGNFQIRGLSEKNCH